MVLDILIIIIFSLVLTGVASYYVFQWLEPYADNRPKIDLTYDFNEDIANYNNDWNNYDYDKDCHFNNKYDYDLASENELSAEYQEYYKGDEDD